jgi:cysteine dioxygenase
MNEIDSLNQLIDQLQDSSRADNVRRIKSMKIPQSEFRRFASWNQEHYTRNCIARTEKFELLLLCWSKDQETPIHCHNGEECWVYAVQGALREERYDFDESEGLVLLNTGVYQKGNISYMSDDMGYHLLRNVDDGRSMSLHLYMNPIDECTYFDEAQGVFMPKDLEYDSVDGQTIAG